MVATSIGHLAEVVGVRRRLVARRRAGLTWATPAQGKSFVERSTARRRVVTIAIAAVVALLASSCQRHLLPPDGEGPLRYRDEIFSQVDITTGLTYGSAPGLDGQTETLKLDLYEPHGDDLTKRPAIVWVHGGSFKTGSRTSPEIVDQAKAFSRMGYLNVSISYRLTEKGCVPFGDECIQGITMAKHDAQAAVRWLRANGATYGIDTARIAVAGSSAGAITAYNVAYGKDDQGSSGNPGFSPTVKAAVSLSGAALTTSPDPGEPPTLDFHGTNDGLVPLSWAENTIDDALADGLIAEQTVWEGAGHVPYGQYKAEIIEQTRNFLYWTMDLRNAAQ